MKQIQQKFKNGQMEIVNVPYPQCKPGHLIVRNHASLVSVGTEKHLLDFAQKNLLGKALARPDLLSQVIAKAQAEGIMEAWRQAMGRLDAPVLPGYSSAGEVLDVGEGVEDFSIGDRVACSGSGYAGHTEIAVVPENLLVKIPKVVEYQDAAFVALGGIALQSVRMAQISLGESVAVIGLGLLGQIAVQLLNSAGCHVIGMDLNPQKTEIALEHGAEAVATDYGELISAVNQISNGEGVDAVIILAATTSNEPLSRAAEICRERGKIVAGGLIGLEIPRQSFYDKELDFVVSRAWGPGLYDPDYSERGVKYPIAYARWTAQRNMAEFIAQLARGGVSVKHLISHSYPLEEALNAYKMILEGDQPYLGVLLTYDDSGELDQAYKSQSFYKIVHIESNRSAVPSDSLGIGLIGAGLFANGTLLPAMKSVSGIHFGGVSTATGLSGRHTADKFGFAYCTTDYSEILNDKNIDVVLISTRHGSHADLVVEAIEAGKHIFVEKPLTVNPEQIDRVIRAYQSEALADKNLPIFMVGFNRRFSPHSLWIKNHFVNIKEPISVHCTVNAGIVPSDHWVHDPVQGGGRIVGEICHFVDLIQYLTGSLPERVYAESMNVEGSKYSDNVSVSIKMRNGSMGSINYFDGGDKRYPRERVEVIGGGAVGVIENFQKASLTRGGKIRSKKNWLSVERGQRGEIEALVNAIQKSSPSPVDFEEYVYTTLTTFAIERSIKKSMPINLNSVKQE